MDSFIFPGLYHLSALQRHGLKMWDALKQMTVTSFPFLSLATADAPGMAAINGFVGHQGRVHCRLYCPLVGRHKPEMSSYYPALQKPQNYVMKGCDHDDVDLRKLLREHSPQQAFIAYKAAIENLVSSTTQTQYKERRTKTGLVKPTIFSGLPATRMFSIPNCFALGIMHLPCLNIPDLFISSVVGKV